MSQKTIQLNPEFLSSGGGKRRDKNNKTRKERKVKPTANVNPSKLRKELLNRIKNTKTRLKRNLK